MRILVTGGAGYIGSVLVPRLLEEGHQVTVVDSLLFRQSSLVAAFAHPGLTLHVRDARDQIFLRDEVKKADVIIPLAALVGARLCDDFPETAESLNREAVRFLASEKGRGQALVYPCTNSGYGVGEKDIYCTEETPLRPISLYGKTKVEAEVCVLEAGGASLRFATLFGLSPRMRLDLLVNDFTFRALRDRVIVLFEGHFRRNFLHVRDAARAFLFAIEQYEKMGGRAFNVGLSDANLSKMDLCRLIQRFTPLEIISHETGKDPDQRNYVVSNERIEKLGFRTAHSLEEGIQEVLRAYPLLRHSGFANA